MKNTVDYYNQTAGGWSEDYYIEKQQSGLIKKFCDCFKLAGTIHPKILDLGCGIGYDSALLAEEGANAIGIDLSENLIEAAKKKVKNAKFFVGDITDKMTALGKFDGIVCLATIIHIDIDKMNDTFNSMANVLKKGGLLLISSFDGTGKNAEKSYVTVNGESYDKNFNSYSASELCLYAHPKFKLVDTWLLKDFEDGWRYYIFLRV